MANPISHHPRLALVTGASGFIGSNLVRVLLEDGVTVRVLLEPEVGTENLAGLSIQRVEGDLRDPPALVRAVQGCDTVYHLGAIYDYWLPKPVEMFRVNVQGTVHMMRAALRAGVERFVLCSSVAALGTLPGEEQANEETLFNNWDNADDYVLSKYMAQAEAFRFNGASMQVVAGLPCFPLGRNDIRPTPTGVMAQQYVEGKNPIAFAGGINCVDVRDVAHGLHACGTRGRPGEGYILGGHNVTYEHLAEKLCAIAGTKPPRRTMHPNKLLWLGRLNDWFGAITGIKPMFSRKNMMFLGGRHLYFDVTKAETELGYEITRFDETIAECVRWFKEERNRVLAGEVVHRARSNAADSSSTALSSHAE